MFDDFSTILQINITAGEVIINLLTAFICGLMISFFYKKTYNGPGYLNSFVNSLLILSMITAVVIMVIGNNLARAFGLVGAMSIIRFRTAVKETQDIIFIFFSLAVGMAAGVGLHSIAVLATIIIGLIFLMLSKTNILTNIKKEYLLQFIVGSADAEPEYSRLLKEHCKNYRLINAKANGDDLMELSYYITLKQKESSVNLLRDLRKIKSINKVNLFFDEEYF